MFLIFQWLGKINPVWLKGKRRKQENKLPPPTSLFDFTYVNNFKANQLQLSPADRTILCKLLGLHLISRLDVPIRRISRQTKQHTHANANKKQTTQNPSELDAGKAFTYPYSKKATRALLQFSAPTGNSKQSTMLDPTPSVSLGFTALQLKISMVESSRAWSLGLSLFLSTFHCLGDDVHRMVLNTICIQTISKFTLPPRLFSWTPDTQPITCSASGT